MLLSPSRTWPRGRCRWLTCARPQWNSATTPAPTCCWRRSAVGRFDRVLAFDRRCGHASGTQRTNVEPLAARRSARHDHARRHGRQPAPPGAGRGAVAGLARAPHRLDAELQNRRQPAARRPAQGLEDRRQDRQQRQGRGRRHRRGLVEARRAGADLRLHAGRFAERCAAGGRLRADWADGGPAAGQT